MTITQPTETNSLHDPNAYYDRKWERMTLSELSAKGGKVTRVRWLTERRSGKLFADLSYVHGELRDGTPVQIIITSGNTLLVNFYTRKSTLVEWAKAEGVFAKGLGLLDNESVLY